MLVAPLVTFAVLLAGLLALRLDAPTPWRSGPCGFWEAFERPCPACGGTRAARALARGQWAKAWGANPAVPAAGVGALLWLGIGTRRYLAGAQPLDRLAMRRRLSVAAIAATGALIANWIYLLSIY